MDGLHALDHLIRKRFDDQAAEQREINPLFVTRDEVDALLKEGGAQGGGEPLLPGLDILGELFRLDEFEKSVLVMVLAPEIASRYERIYAYLQDDLNRKYPTVALISSLLSADPEAKVRNLSYFSPGSPLRLFRLINLADPGDGTTSLHHPVKTDESVRDFILGAYRLDSRLQTFCRLIPPAEDAASSPVADLFADKIREGVENDGRFLIHLHGRSDAQKKNSARRAASRLDHGLLEVHTPRALNAFDSIGDLTALLYREAVLSGTLLYFDAFDALIEHEQYAVAAPQFLEGVDRYSWLTFLASQKPWKPQNMPAAHMFLSYAFSAPDYTDALFLWEKHLKEVDAVLAAEHAPMLAALFRFGEDEIGAIARRLKTRQFVGETVDKRLLYETCREQVPEGIGRLAQPLKSDAGLEDIALPETQVEQLKTIVMHFSHQRRVFDEWGFRKHFQSPGIGALFVGPPGTGKSMAASILANEMGLDLYRIDLSQVVSKYIGETEKNLSGIFEAAEGSGVMLFFDEADAIFGKRTEVRDAHDRYANIETSYLLQRMEAYDGPVVLASNFKRNIDDAFMRRLRFIVEFPFPDETMREQIWNRVFPGSAPLAEGIDYPFLAERFKLSGAAIRNAALFAAFLAAEEGRAISMEHILRGIKAELRKTGESYKPSDFGAFRDGD